MSVVLTIAGESFNYPTDSDDDWGTAATDWAVAVSTNLLQRTGGTFTLTNDVNFGASFGTIQTYLKSRTSNIATAGFIRLARADVISWRNEANGANLDLAVNSSNELTFNGVPLLLSPGGILTVADGGTGIGTYTVGDILYATGATTLAKLGIGAANRIQVSTGTAPSWALLVNANVDAAAAIDRSKLANGTADHVLINDGSGVMSSEAQLAKTRGGTGISSTATFPASGTVVTRDATETLTNKTLTTPTLTTPVANGVRLAVNAKTANYTATATDYYIPCSASGGAFQITLPAAAAGNTGAVYVIKKTDSTFNAVTVSDGTLTTTLNTQNESIEVVSDGAAWTVLRRDIPSVWTSYTPTGTWLINTTYTGFWRRVGDSMECRFRAATSNGPTAVSLFIGIPSGIAIDTAKLTGQTQDISPPLGYGVANDGTTTGFPITVVYSTTTVISLRCNDVGGTFVTNNSAVTHTTPFAFGTGDGISGFFVAPISGWNG